MLNYDRLVFDRRLCRLAGSQGLPVRPGLPTSGGSTGKKYVQRFLARTRPQEALHRLIMPRGSATLCAAAM